MNIYHRKTKYIINLTELITILKNRFKSKSYTRAINLFIDFIKDVKCFNHYNSYEKFENNLCKKYRKELCNIYDYVSKKFNSIGANRVMICYKLPNEFLYSLHNSNEYRYQDFIFYNGVQIDLGYSGCPRRYHMYTLLYDRDHRFNLPNNLKYWNESNEPYIDNLEYDDVKLIINSLFKYPYNDR